MSSWSDRQSSTTTELRCCGVWRVEWNFPPKMRVIGDSTDLPIASINEVELSAERMRYRRTVPASFEWPFLTRCLTNASYPIGLCFKHENASKPSKSCKVAST